VGKLILHSLNMHRLRLVPAVFATAFVLGACSGSIPGFGPQPEPPPADPKLFPARYKTEVADFMRTYLNNPTKVKDAFIGEPVLKTMEGLTQYMTCVRYNPRDSKNVYEGVKSNLATFLSGRLNQFLPGNPELCAGLVYQRFPEVESMVP